MKPLQSKEQIEEMRRKLYDRSGAVQSTKHKLSDIKVDVRSDWSVTNPESKPEIEKKRPEKEQEARELEPEPDSIPDSAKKEPEDTVDLSEKQPKRRYRTFILLGSLLIFIIVTLVSSLFLFFGGNQISNNNIEIVANGPQFIGGGEEYPFQVAVSNQNAVPIESATLIIKYPQGTRSVGDEVRNLFEERIPIDSISPGEIRNIPLTVAVFGEESAKKTIEATIEYRINGSNGMFYKESESLEFNISSSPLVLRVDSLEKVASGQEVEVTLTAVSNASNPLTDVIVSASYPNSFSYQDSSPGPDFGQNVWVIDEILPDEEKTITLRGTVSGQTNDNFRINFSAGPADPDNQFLVGAILAEGSVDFLIERPFIDVRTAVGGDSDGEVILPQGASANIDVSLTNTLGETIYDLLVEVIPSGNALTEDSISSSNGFFDSNRGTVRWEVSNNSSFERVLPGDSRNLKLRVSPGDPEPTSSFEVDVNVYARRVAEESVQETLIGTSRVEVKYTSTINLGSQASFISGPVPPQVGETTQYALTIVAEAGLNDVTGAIIETSLPLHSEWLDEYDGDGELSYNTVSKKIVWDIGNIDSGERKQLIMQVQLNPSSSQINTRPILMGDQSYRANDRFTGALLQDSARAVTTELSTEMGFGRDSGRVIR